ncbi:MAG: hypothetical protein LUH58_05275 [Lachnospiraceae bacterium]|nr:hypothetical protein [Lachnospiraceae bacterium]
MYCLPEMDSSIIQKLVSNELIRGFHHLFNTSDAVNVPNPDNVEMFIECSDTLYQISLEHPELVQGLTIKLGIMLKALKDAEYEYTFDEFGEFLLYEMIRNVDADVEGGLIWELGGTWFDRQELREELTQYYEDCYAVDEEPEEKKREMIERTVVAVTCFPRLADELKGNTVMSFLFGDTDFMLFYDEKFDRVIDFMREDWDCGFSGGKMTKVPLKEEEPKDGEEKK